MKRKTWIESIKAAISELRSPKQQDLRYALCSRSFFPEILPPIFTSRPFADAITKVQPPGKFIADFSGTKPKVYKSELDTYIYRRPANQRRNFGIVHPVSFHALTSEMATNWKSLHAAAQSSCSVSSPLQKPTGHTDSAIQPKITRVLERERKLDIRARAKYIVRTDITRFYPSIYTHGIAWAIDGKSAAKAKKQDYSQLGNRLDLLCRNTQDAQTIGVSIGQDTFRVLAEIILSDIDKKVGLTAKNCYRYSDDYEVACRSHDEAEKVIAELEKSLHDYGLALNHSKTKIIELPQRIEDSWISKLGAFDFHKDDQKRPRSQLAKIVRLFDTAFDIVKDYPGSPALSYAIALLPGFKNADSEVIAKEILTSIEKYLAHAIVVERGCMSRAIRYFALLTKMDPDIKKSQGFMASLDQVLKSGIELGIDSDMAWGLYGHIAFDYKVSSAVSVDEMLASGRSAVHTLMLAAHMSGAWDFDIELLKKCVSQKGVNSSEWLTIYELARHDICQDSKNKINGTIEMKHLLDNGVSFIDVSPDQVSRILQTTPLQYVFYDDTDHYSETY